jgi:hypothetical protein
LGEESLNKAQRAHLRFLKTELSKYEHEARRINHHPDVLNDLHRAREQLRKYVEELRAEGVNI